MNENRSIGITIGDFNGIGPELILKTLRNEVVLNYCTPIIYGTSYILNFYSELFDIPALDIHIAKTKNDVKQGAINLRVCSTDRIEITPGIPSLESGKVALQALELAVEDIKDGVIHNILTAPIDKKSTVDAGLSFNGHTQFFAKIFESDAQMLLLDDTIKVAMVTGHTALNEVSKSLTIETVSNCISTLNAHLKTDFGITKPKIAVLGFNPHSGDNGLIGTEEKDVILPAIKSAANDGIIAVGPYPPDGFFGSSNVKNFDAVVGMYHDQVLIPFKQNSFSDGVNFTAGLPIIRTSPDHGTAYDIAGQGVADTSSFVNALYLIQKIHRNRLKFYDTTITQLPYRDHRKEKFSIGIPDLN